MVKVPHAVTDLASLKEVCGEPHPHTQYKIQTKLTGQARAFLEQAPFVLLSTIASNGEPTVSPKGGAPGFVGLDETSNTLYLPDIRGNNLIFSLQNILENPKVGLLFFLPGTGETMRVHGSAQLSRDPELCSRYTVGKKEARLVTVIQVSSYYFHCSMSLNIAKLWQPETWVDKMKISWKEEIEPNLPAEAKLDSGF